MSKNQFTGTATQPQRNRKFCQFKNDQYCMPFRSGKAISWLNGVHFSWDPPTAIRYALMGIFEQHLTKL